MTELEEKIIAWAQGDDDVRAVAVVGSRARVDSPADEWSDWDVVMFAHNPAALLERDDWVRAFGSVKLTFLEPTAVGGQRERRVLYEDGTDVDFSIVPFELTEHAAAAQVAARGIRVLLDKDGELQRRLREVPPRQRPPLPTQHELGEVIEDFYYHGVWAAKKLRRGELFTAKQAVDSYMKRLLLRMLEWHARARDPEVTPGTRDGFSRAGPIPLRSRSCGSDMRATTRQTCGGRSSRRLNFSDGWRGTLQTVSNSLMQATRRHLERKWCATCSLKKSHALRFGGTSASAPRAEPGSARAQPPTRWLGRSQGNRPTGEPGVPPFSKKEAARRRPLVSIPALE